MSIKKQLQTIRLYIGKYLLDRKLSKFDNSSINYNKILFLRHDGKIGDYIVSSFAFRELKKQNPNLQIGVVCSQKNQYLFENNLFIDQLYPVKSKSIFNYVQKAKKISNEKYDVLIAPTTFLRNRDLLLIKYIDAKINIGYQKENYQLFDKNIIGDNLHFSQIYQKTLEMIGYHNIDTTYDIPFNSDSEYKVKNFIHQNNLNQFIAINFFGAGSSRSFNDKNIKSFLDYIQKHSNLPIVILTSPAVTEKLKQHISSLNNIFIFEDTKTIFDNIELIKAAKLIISPDTSIIHIASGLNKPMIAFYSDGLENFTHWHPNSKNTVHLVRYQKNINEVRPEQLLPEWLA